MHSYAIVIRRDDHWWIAEIPELNGLTQGRSHDEAIAMAREWIALDLDQASDSFDVHVALEPEAH